MTNHQQRETSKLISVGSLATELEAAALNARNLLHVANRELLENVELGLSLVAAAQRYIDDVIAINRQLCVNAAQIDGLTSVARGRT